MAHGSRPGSATHHQSIPDQQPIRSFTRSVLDHSGSLEINVPKLGRSIHDIGVGDEVDLPVFEDRFVIGEIYADPLLTVERACVTDRGGVYVRPGANCVAVLDLVAGDDVAVDVYRDRIVYRCPGGNDAGSA